MCAHLTARNVDIQKQIRDGLFYSYKLSGGFLLRPTKHFLSHTNPYQQLDESTIPYQPSMLGTHITLCSKYILLIFQVGKDRNLTMEKGDR
jgi:hypothetical protein